MEFSNNRPPMYDINNLDEEFEIRYDYDSNGNLTRIRKVRRNGGGWPAFFLLVLIGLAGYAFFGV